MAVACTLFVLLHACPGALTLEDILVGAFMHFVGTEADRPRVSIADTRVGLGIAVSVMREALQWRYPLGATAA